MSATVDDAAELRAAIAAAADPAAFERRILAALYELEPGTLVQLGAMPPRNVEAPAPRLPILNPCDDQTLFARVLHRHPELVADAMARVTEGEES